MRSRKFVVGVVLALVFSAMPHTAMAANFDYEVTFPGDGDPEEVTSTSFESGPEAGTFFSTVLSTCNGGDQSSAQAHTGTYSLSASSGDPLCMVAGVSPGVGVEYLFEWWGGDFGGPGSRRQAWGFCDSSALFIGSPTYFVLTSGGGWQPTTFIATAPSNAQYFCFKSDSDHTIYMDDPVIYGPAFDSEGCIGAGEMAWGQPSMVSADDNYGDGGTLQQPTGWGDKWHSSESCVVSQHASAHLVFEPPSTPATGDSFMFNAGLWCTKDNVNCGANMYWLDADGDRINDPVTGTAVAFWSWLNNGPGGPLTEPREMRQWGDWPANAEFIEIAITRDTMSVFYSIANVEGTDNDPDDPDFDCDNYDEGTCGSGGGSDQNFQDCAPPLDPLDVPGWLAWIGCLIDVGVQLLLGAIANVALGVLDQLSAILEDLFVPTEVGTAWDDFLDLFASKVPMVWVTEVLDFLNGMLTAGNLQGAAIPTSMTLLGAPVSLDFSAVFSPLTPYRFVLVGLVYIAGAWAIFRAVGRAMGMSGGDG